VRVKMLTRSNSEASNGMPRQSLGDASRAAIAFVVAHTLWFAIGASCIDRRYLNRFMIINQIPISKLRMLRFNRSVIQMKFKRIWLGSRPQP